MRRRVPADRWTTAQAGEEAAQVGREPHHWLPGASRGHHEAMTRRWVLLAHATFGLAALLAIVAVGGAVVVGLSWKDALESYLVTNVAIGVSAAPCGWLLARARPRNPLGWLFLGLAVAPLLTAATVPLWAYGLETGWPKPVIRALVTVFMFSWGWGVFVCLPIALQLFPTGQPVTRRWGWGVWLTVGMGLLGTYGTGPTPELGASTYLLLPGYEVAESLLWLTVLVWPLALVSLVTRYIRADADVRGQLLWLLLAALVTVSLNLPWAFSLHEGSEILFLLAFPLIPLAATVAVLRSHLFDVRLAVSRFLVYELLTVLLLGGYLALVAVLDDQLRGVGAPVLATAVVAVAFNPLRLLLQRWVHRALYGLSHEPARLVTTVGERLVDEDLGGLLEALRAGLRVPWVELRVGEQVVSVAGTRAGEHLEIPLLQGGRPLGTLTVGCRRGEHRLPAADRSVLELLAAPLAVAVRATILGQELQVSRARVVEAATQERLRLRRELHDSLGPVLTGATLMAESVGLTVRRDPERAEQLATDLAEQLRAAVGGVRRIVYGLRPAVLDEVGLVAALRRQEGQLGHLALAVEAADDLPELPPAVEVAAYRVASEAVTNAVRHTTATSVRVALRGERDGLHLVVTDDGGAGDGRPAWSPGVGLRSMADRVQEVGGRLVAGPTPGGGRVEAVLPLSEAT